MNVKFTRLNNLDGSYTYTDADGTKFEIVNFKHYGEADEWHIKVFETGEGVAVFDKLRECREWFA